MEPPPASGALPLLCAGLTAAAWAAYLAWALAPAPPAWLLARLPELPARYWALAPPALLVAAVCAYGVAYGFLALALTPPPRAAGARWDGHSRRPAAAAAAAAARAPAVAVGGRGGGGGGGGGAGGTPAPPPPPARTPAFGDVPLTLVNEAVFGRGAPAGGASARAAAMARVPRPCELAEF